MNEKLLKKTAKMCSDLLAKLPTAAKQVTADLPEIAELIARHPRETLVVKLRNPLSEEERRMIANLTEEQADRIGETLRQALGTVQCDYPGEADE